jgi:hypothetical protein
LWNYQKKINYKILEHLVNLFEEVQKICCFSYLKSVVKKIYVGSDSFALQNGLSHQQLVIGWK